MVLKLNVGAGRQRLEGYIGIDFQEGKGVDEIALAWELPYVDGEVDEIYTSHMIEHMSEEQLDWLLKEFARVLKPGGILEIVCPDLEIAFRKWLDGGYDFRWGFGIKRIFGWQRNKGEFHYTGFTQTRFKRLLPEYRFKIKIIRNQDSRWRRDARMWPKGDLYVKAIKI